MISKEYNDRLTDVEQVDFEAPIPYMGDVAASSSSSVEQKSMVVKEANNDVGAYSLVNKAAARMERTPVFIPSTGKKSSGTVRPPKGRNVVVHTGVTILMLVVVIGLLAAVVPTGSGQASALGQLFNPVTNMISSKQNNTALIAAQAATATAVTVDGYDASNQNTYNGVQSTFTLPDGTTTGTTAGNTTVPTPTPAPVTSGAPAINGSSGGISSSSGTIADSSFNNYFTAGQCTYWADYEYHHLTGYAVTWSGNASYWAIGAGAAGWNVSPVPHVPSIIVLQPGYQGAGADGHVAVVESINANGTVHTSNWNVIGWGVFSWGDYSSGAGVQYIWHS
jgi:surface antigen